MAKNWSMKEATKEILAGNKEAIVDVGRRFPLTANAIAKMGNNEGAITIINALPEHISARKIESVLKDGVQEIEDEDEEATEVEETKPEKPAKKEKPAKEEKKAKKEKKTSKEDDEDFMNDIPEEVDEELNLEAMSEVELFKLAKKRGLKPAPKQKKQYYIDLLNPTDDSDDWDDEEEEKPAKKEKKAKKEDKPAKKEKKAAKKDDDEEDDWDI